MKISPVDFHASRREPFATAIIDPPWPYNKGPKSKGFVQYSTLTVDEIGKLPVGDVVSSYVFLWTAKMFLPDGFRILQQWGFRPRSFLVWVKTSGGGGKASGGVGSWFMSGVEIALLGTREQTPFIRSRRSDVFEADRLRHSKKPEFLHEFVERLFPEPRLEMFARRSRPGWTCVGNEAPGDEQHDIRESLALLLTGWRPEPEQARYELAYNLKGERIV